MVLEKKLNVERDTYRYNESGFFTLPDVYVMEDVGGGLGLLC